MVATRSSETSINKKQTRGHILEDGILHSHRRGNLKSYILVLSSYLDLGCQSVISRHQVFKSKHCKPLSSLPCVLHAPPISPLLISSLWLYYESTNREYGVGTAQTEIHFIDDSLISFKSWKVLTPGMERCVKPYGSANVTAERRASIFMVERPSKSRANSRKTHTRLHDGTIQYRVTYRHCCGNIKCHNSRSQTASGLHTAHVFYTAQTLGTSVRVPLRTWICIAPPIILGRRPSPSAHESESMLRTYLVYRGKQERERETSQQLVGVANGALVTAILVPQRLSCYWGKIVSLRMLTNLRLADFHLTTAQQRTTGQNLPSDLRASSALLSCVSRYLVTNLTPGPTNSLYD
jgi:hypothetical protein